MTFRICTGFFLAMAFTQTLLRFLKVILEIVTIFVEPGLLVVGYITWGMQIIVVSYRTLMSLSDGVEVEWVMFQESIMIE